MGPNVLIEGVVCQKIMDFMGDDFLYTGTLSKLYSEPRVDHFGVSTKRRRTGVQRAYESPSRLAEGFKSGLSSWASYFNAIRHQADITVFEKIYSLGHIWTRSDVELAAQEDRVDVIRFFCDKGAELDQRVLHSAVRRGNHRVVKYLLDKECPLDSVKIDWGYGQEVIDDLNTRSLELAIRSKHMGIVKELCINNFPFVEETFREALNTRNTRIIDYIRGRGCVPQNGVFEDSVYEGDHFAVKYLMENKLLKDEWGLYGTSLRRDPTMFWILLDNGVQPIDDDVENCIRDHDLESAIYLTSSYECSPTKEAFDILFERKDLNTSGAVYIKILQWLYFDMRCFLDEETAYFIYTDMYDHPNIINWIRDHTDHDVL